MNSQNQTKRGLLIVFEGLDRVGKSTQCHLLKDYLINIKKEKTELINFPDRNTPSGKQLNEMLKAIRKMNIRASHLLFSFNRWEKKDDILEILNSGVNLIIDRYAFSGYCYSGLDKSWALTPDQMLPRPDIVFQLDADEDKIINREDYGNEIYEKHEFQKRLKEIYKFFHTYKYWKVINASREIDDINREIVKEIEELISFYNNEEIKNEKNNYPNSVKEDLFTIKGSI